MVTRRSPDPCRKYFYSQFQFGTNFEEREPEHSVSVRSFSHACGSGRGACCMLGAPAKLADGFRGSMQLLPVFLRYKMGGWAS